MLPGYLPILNASALLDAAGVRRLVVAARSRLGLQFEVFERDVRPILCGFAEFIQLLPASEVGHHAQPGGLVLHALETALLALEARHGRVLPHGAAPEAIGERAPRWTYAIFIAALLHHVDTTIGAVQVTLNGGDQELGVWSPLAGSMVERGATGYRVAFADRHAESAGRGRALFDRTFPAPVRAWLAEDDALMRELDGVLSGDPGSSAGVIGELVRRACVESVRRNLLTGLRVRFANARGVPLIERLMAAVRELLAEGGRLPLNGCGAAGWVHDGDLWLDTARLLHEVRTKLRETAAQSEAIPDDDQAFVETWQAYGALVPEPQTGNAQWRVIVVGDSYRHVRMLLRFPLSVLYPDRSAFPEPMAGRILIGSADAPDARPQLEKPSLAAADTGSPMEQEPSPSPASGVMTAEDFMDWLREGFGNGTLRSNEPGAALHFVPEGLLLVSPRIFREFVDLRGNAAVPASESGKEQGDDKVRSIQRELLRAGWHLQAAGGINMIAYRLMQGSRAVGRISGIVIRHPERFGIEVSAPNPALVRIANAPREA